MGVEQLAALLRKAHDNAPYKGKTLAIHLFGMMYAHDLQRVNIREVREMADIPRLEPTIRDGMNLRKIARIHNAGKLLAEEMGILSERF